MQTNTQPMVVEAVSEGTQSEICQHIQDSTSLVKDRTNMSRCQNGGTANCLKIRGRPKWCWSVCFSLIQPEQGNLKQKPRMQSKNERHGLLFTQLPDSPMNCITFTLQRNSKQAYPKTWWSSFRLPVQPSPKGGPLKNTNTPMGYVLSE